MITDEQFKNNIEQIGNRYEAIKDLIYAKNSPLNPLGKTAQGILGELSKLRDIACMALRESHITQNFNDN